MKIKLPNTLNNAMTKAGILLIVISLGIFTLTINLEPRETSGVFLVNYLISVGYFIGLLIHIFASHRWSFSKGKIQHTILLLTLWFISAFSLNLEMHIFESSTTWLCVCLVASCIALILASHLDLLGSVFLRTIVFVTLGFALIVFSYYALFLLPLYPISMIGILALGISLHTYIPLFLAIVTLVILARALRKLPSLWVPVLVGTMLPVVVSTIFLADWYETEKKIDRLTNQHTLNEGTLPKWVIVAQRLKIGFTTERMLKAGLIYYAVDRDNISWNNFSESSFDEPLEHDPLVVLATFCFKQPKLDDQEKINILKSMYHLRHQAADRLWSGDKLSTTNVVSNIRLFPSHRMAYTEQTMTIHNAARNQWNSQEAIYTFSLGEGSAVSSLSLWINGIEEKSVLTTKAKADSAYKTIVGVEQRDPSVVHWQEGNTISVRVFPCTRAEDRKFKIGITSPLVHENNRLTYRSLRFEGPTAHDALHTTQVTYDGKLTGLQVPNAFKETKANTFVAEANGQENWEISFNAKPLSDKAFSFANQSYQLVNHTPKYVPTETESIYLDLNAQWTTEEFDQVWTALINRKVYAFDEGLKLLSATNKDEVFERLQQQQFSVFPLYEIKNPEQSLFITKNSAATPNLNDLENTEFSKKLSAYLSKPTQLKSFHIGEITSPYLKALNELRVLHSDNGKLADLLKLLKTRKFLKYEENDDQVLIGNAGMMIRKTELQTSQNAPDHLLRLFAYNDIMKKVAPDYFNKQYVNPALAGEAETAFIVSPVSSLIVLETKKDYDRFDIDANKNSLKNASMHASGAVPEPHEWALIVLAAMVVGFLLIKNKGFKHAHANL